MNEKMNIDFEIVSNLIDSTIHIFVTYAGQVLGATIILILGFYFAGKLSGIARKNLSLFNKIDPLIVPIIGNVIRYGIIIITLIAVLGQFGVQTTSIIAILGAAGLAIGLALQGTLSNVAAGVMLLLLRPFTTGDWVETGGVSGTIKEVGLFTTIINTFDNVYVSIPNSSIWNSTITNHSHYKTRRIDVDIGIHYDTDLELASKVLLQLGEDERVLNDPNAPQFLVIKYDDSSIVVRLRLYAHTKDWFALYSDLMKRLKPALDKAGIEIPYPHRVITSKSD
ncbi:MAG: mechanosensitive ion channel family protein [Proteobacteria bacterium]|jgi:small conductance mechanosensitive channel|nr:mechanosensitive ion channel family protein [Pseudomonadota bacterium]MDA1136000.1 mechanosensitive ion channel family protein [Pseudomonadota bacterium]|tara:strand:- start:128 stop:970 length:843 start_codon:yes stop_codon:yes gene_type:complete